MRKRSTPGSGFEAQAIPLSDREFLVPLILPSRKQLGKLERLLRTGQTFHVKSVGEVDRAPTGGYLLFAKLRKAGAI